MNEQQWFAGENPELMLAYLIGQRLLTPHKRRMFKDATVAVDSLPERCHIIRDIFGNPWRPLFVPSERVPFVAHSTNIVFLKSWRTPTVLSLAEAAYAETLRRKCERCGGSGWSGEDAEGEVNYYCPACSGVGSIDTGQLDSSRVLILADALEEAGCTSEEILNHLRGEERILKRHVDSGPYGYGPREVTYEDRWIPLRGPHVRGCWALDCILEKE